jgi:O-antigen ligase
VIGIILFLATTVWVGAPLTAICIPVVLFRWYQNPRRWTGIQENAQWRAGFHFLLAFALFAIINFSINTPELENFEKSHLGAFPFLALLPLAFFTATYFTEFDRRLFCLLVIAEIFIGVAEFSLGIRSLVGAEDLVQTDFETTDFMYFKRVYGLSSNSSIFALKVLFFAAFTLPIKPMKQLFDFESDRLLTFYTMSCLFLIFTGAFLTFNRTTLAALAAHITLFTLTQPRSRATVLPITLFLAVIMVAALEGQRPGTLATAWSYAIEQLSVGGRSPVELSLQSGRGYLFKQFWDFSIDNAFFGNASAKAWMWYRGRLFHAHNSFLTVLASNGLLIGIPFLLLFLRIFCRHFWVMLPFIVFSTTQYGLFWGFSTADTLFYTIFVTLTVGDFSRTRPVPFGYRPLHSPPRSTERVGQHVWTP